MRVACFFGVAATIFACAAQNPLGAAVTCPAVSLQKAPGACDFVATQVCSDSHFYALSCQDDGTCTCTQDSNNWNSFLAADNTTTYCSSINDTSQFHVLATNCVDPQSGLGLNVNP